VTVFGRAVISEFGKKHNRARKPLARFLDLVREAEWEHFPDVKASFPGTDYASESQTYIFNIGGNRYRLLAGINFEDQSISVEQVMTHEEYDRKAL
jgi:mRNA interferase HigB